MTYDVSNPVIPSPSQAYSNQQNNFPDPFVFRHDPSQKGVAVVSLAQLHKPLIYTSTNLIEWTEVSEFGPANAIGHVCECPGIFPLPLDGNETNINWITKISLNPSRPPSTTGPGKQYVVGSFDGTTFLADPTLSGIAVFQGFQGSGTFAALGWNATEA